MARIPTERDGDLRHKATRHPPRLVTAGWVLLAPLLLVGAAAGALRALSLREPPGSRGRRARTAAWVLLLLGGCPLWLVLAAVLRLW